MFGESGMCLVVNMDLVVPAVISSEFMNIRGIEGYDDHKDEYLKLMTISRKQIMNYARRMKSWGLGMVVVNFEGEDAERYLNSRPDIFCEVEGVEGAYSVLPIEYKNKEERIREILDEFISSINYSPTVLRTVGLLRK